MLSFVSCTKDSYKSAVESERKDIESFFTSNKIAYNLVDGVYRVENNTNADDISIAKKDSVWFNYSIHTFRNGRGELLDSNIKEIVEGSNLNSELLTLEPRAIKYGTSPLMKGIELGIQSCLQNGEYELVIPFSLAYDDKYLGVISPFQTMYVYLKILKVQKN